MDTAGKLSVNELTNMIIRPADQDDIFTRLQSIRDIITSPPINPINTKYTPYKRVTKTIKKHT